jgi:thioredoxin-related protein
MMMKSEFVKSNVKLTTTMLIVLLLLLKVVKRNHRVHLLLQTAQITLKIQSWMKQDMRRFSSLEYEQSVPWLYYSCIKSGYLCKYCELFQKEVFQSVHTDQALLQTFPNVYKLLYLMNIIPASTVRL